MIGVVADDITGAGDIGIMFAKSWHITHVYTFESNTQASYAQEGHGKQSANVVILDTNSRFDTAEAAYAKVYESTKQLQALGATQFINKTCSVFRGNIGAEFDAMLDALDERFAIVVLGFPKNGRTTVNGIHYVHGKKLEASEFRNDPVHPMRRSDLQGILQSQTKRKAATVNHSVIEQGTDALQAEISKRRTECNYLILDVVNQASLRTIAEAVQSERVLCGSSALAEELALLQKPTFRTAPIPIPPLNRQLGIFIAAGSLMPQTGDQIRYLRDKGTLTLELDTMALLQPEGRDSLLDKLVNQASELIAAGQDVIVHSTNIPSSVELTKLQGTLMGLSNTQISRLVSSSIAEITAQVLSQTCQNRAVIAGGDTSASVCERLGIKGMRIDREIQPGLPSCITFTDPSLLLVLKSGSFGGEVFFEQAINHLKAH